MADEEKGFVIRDKRMFSEDASDGAPEEEKSKKEEEKPAKDEEPDEKPTGSDDESEEASFQLPEVNFSTFVFSLSSSALLHFGEVPDPSTGKTQKNLAMAKHTIDILGLLEEKTKGNLTEDEKQLLKNILYDLRMRYVKEKE